MNKPGDIWHDPPSGDISNDPSLAIVGVLLDVSPVTLIGAQDGWCYVEGTDPAGHHVEGWMHCDILLSYKTTPLPTPNLTPERP